MVYISLISSKFKKIIIKLYYILKGKLMIYISLISSKFKKLI